MTKYNCIALNSSGELVRLEVSAKDKVDAKKKAKDCGYIPQNKFVKGAVRGLDKLDY